MDEKIIEKPLFFPGFFNTSRKSLEALGNTLGDPLGMPWGALGDTLGDLGNALGGLGDALGGLLGGPGHALEALGVPWEALLGEPSQEKGFPRRKPLPGSTCIAKIAKNCEAP